VRAIKSLQARGLSLDIVRKALAANEAATEVLPRVEHIEVELRRIEQEVTNLGQWFAALPPRSDARRAIERSIHTSMVCALGLAQELASLLPGT
jgi:hypothetical protein